MMIHQIPEMMMSVSEPLYWQTTVSEVRPETVYVRGIDINTMIGRLPFAATCFLTIRGRLPTPGETDVMDACLNATLDYGLGKPGTVAARYVVSANPNMVAGLAAAVLACGEYTLAPEDAGRFIQTTFERYKASGKSLDEYAVELVAELRATKARMPGFGHPVFKKFDPRAQSLKNVAVRVGVWNEMGDWYEAVHRAFIVAVNKPDLPINDMGMTAVLLAQLGFAPAEMNGISLLSSLPGVIAHISEEFASKKRIRIMDPATVDYPTTSLDLDAELASAGWPSV
jgi:citryl-CoA lyase